MKVQCTDRKTFELLDKGKSVGKLVYKGLFSDNAQLFLGKEEYKVKSARFFGTKIHVSQEEKELAIIQMNWSGNLEITYVNNQKLWIKPTSFFMNKYQLLNEKEEELLRFFPKFRWSKFQYEYEIKESSAQDIDKLLVLTGVYAVNYYMGIATAVASA